MKPRRQITFDGPLVASGILDSGETSEATGIQVRIGERYLVVLGLSEIEARAIAQAEHDSTVTITVAWTPS